MGIQTHKAMLLFQLRAYHGYTKEDLEHLTIKQLKPLMHTQKSLLRDGLKTQD